MNNLPKQLGRRSKKIGQSKKLNRSKKVLKNQSLESKLTKLGRPKSKRGRKSKKELIAIAEAKLNKNVFDTEMTNEIAEEDLDELLNEMDSLDDEVFENPPNQEKFKINITGNSETTCNCPSLNLQSFNMFVSNPKIRDQRTLDEFAINLRILQRSEEFLIFSFNESKFLGDDCCIRLKRVDSEKQYDLQSNEIKDAQNQQINFENGQVQTNEQINENQEIKKVNSILDDLKQI